MKNLSEWTIGVDLGDRNSTAFALNRLSGEVSEFEFEMNEDSVRDQFKERERCRVTFEVGGQSRWFKRVLHSMEFDVCVVDPRRIALITKNVQKNDRNDAMRLAELASADQMSTRLTLLNPVTHRSDEMQADLSILKCRNSLVEVRTKFMNLIRGVIKAMGTRLATSSAPRFHHLKESIPSVLAPALEPIFDQIELLTNQIRGYDRTIKKVQEERYPEVCAMKAIRGVGTLTAIAYRLTLGDATRFKRSRQTAAYLGLCPKQHESGAIKKELGITKCGDSFVRKLLLQSAHYILGPFGGDCDLRNWGMRLVNRGGAAKKQRAAVAVARKLAVLLHRLWVDQTEYEPLRNQVASPT